MTPAEHHNVYESSLKKISVYVSITIVLFFKKKKNKRNQNKQQQQEWLVLEGTSKII